MLPRQSNKYIGNGPLTLAKLTHQFEGVDDIEFLAIMDAVERLEPGERQAYRHRYIELCRTRGR